jgi:hypothetical protein
MSGGWEHENMKILIATLSILIAAAFLGGCPSRDPEDEIRAMFDDALACIREGRYEDVWNFYSQEFRQKIVDGYEAQKVTVRKELAKNSDWIGKWVRYQTGLSPQDFLELPPREIEARANRQFRDDMLRRRIVGPIHVEGDFAYIKVEHKPGESPINLTLIHRDGRWLFHAREFRPE